MTNQEKKLEYIKTWKPIATKLIKAKSKEARTYGEEIMKMVLEVEEGLAA